MKKPPTDIAQELLRLLTDDHGDAGPICELGERLAHAVLAQAEEPKPRPTTLLRQTYTYALLEVDAATYADVRGRLTHEPDHYFDECDGREVINMHGLALVEAPAETKPGDPCQHHWHVDKNPTRTHRPGWDQVRCCHCGEPAWFKHLFKGCPTRYPVGPAMVPGQVEVEPR